MIFSKKDIGNYGEKLACKFLKKLGYKIIDKNYRTRAGEIDIITKDQKSFVFVEVKTRSDARFGHPEQNVHFHKMRHFQLSVQIYLLENNIRDPFRLDVVSVDLSYEPAEIKHFKNVTM